MFHAVNLTKYNRKQADVVLETTWISDNIQSVVPNLQHNISLFAITLQCVAWGKFILNITVHS